MDTENTAVWQRAPDQCPNCRSTNTFMDAVDSELNGALLGETNKQAMDCDECGAHFYNEVTYTDGGIHPDRKGDPIKKNKFSPCCGAEIKRECVNPEEMDGDLRVYFQVCESCDDEVKES